MRKSILLLLLASLGLLLPSPVAALEPGEGVIEGQVINGTANGSSVADQEITLTIYLDDAEFETRTALTGTDGSFRFSELPTGASYSYDVVLFYQTAEYRSERLSFSDDSYAKSVVLDVYDATESPEAVQIEMAHIIVYVEQDILHVEEYIIFSNNSDRAYIGTPTPGAESTRETLKFSLPEGAADVQIGDGLMECCVTITENSLVDSIAVLPGAKEVVYAYHIYPDTKKYALSKSMNYPTKNLMLLVQGEGIDVSSEQLQIGEPITAGGATFSHLDGNDIAPGEQISVQLSGLPVVGSLSNMTWLALVLALLAIGVLLVFALRRRKQGAAAPARVRQPSYQETLEELAQLDDDFEDGKIDKEAYLRLRAEKKSRLVKLARSNKGNTGSTNGKP